MIYLTTSKRSDGRNTKKYFVIHHTGGANFTYNCTLLSGTYNPKSERNVSVHYVVGQSANQIAKIGKHEDILWHVGVGDDPKTGKRINMNPQCLGIEICSNGYEYTAIQFDMVTKLIRDVATKEGISPQNIIRHADTSGYRGKWDVGPNFYKHFESWKDYVNYVFNGDKKEKELIQKNSFAWLALFEAETILVRAQLALHNTNSFLTSEDMENITKEQVIQGNSDAWTELEKAKEQILAAQKSLHDSNEYLRTN